MQLPFPFPLDLQIPLLTGELLLPQLQHVPLPVETSLPRQALLRLRRVLEPLLCFALLLFLPQLLFLPPRFLLAPRLLLLLPCLLTASLLAPYHPVNLRRVLVLGERMGSPEPARDGDQWNCQEFSRQVE